VEGAWIGRKKTHAIISPLPNFLTHSLIIGDTPKSPPLPGTSLDVNASISDSVSVKWNRILSVKLIMSRLYESLE
jgi:hypothetical protein